jgi:hypothetical protein
MALARRRRAGQVGASWAKLARAKASGDTARIIEPADHCMLLCSSEQRLLKLLRAVGDQPPEVFWPVWLKTWSAVDFIADWQPKLPSLPIKAANTTLVSRRPDTGPSARATWQK